MVKMEFFICIIPLAALWPWGRPSLQQNGLDLWRCNFTCPRSFQSVRGINLLSGLCIFDDVNRDMESAVRCYAIHVTVANGPNGQRLPWRLHSLMHRTKWSVPLIHGFNHSWANMGAMFVVGLF